MLLQEDTKKRKILTESGVWIPATYKTDRYERWKGKSKVDHIEAASDDSDDDKGGKKPAQFGSAFPRRGVPMGMNLEGTILYHIVAALIFHQPCFDFFFLIFRSAQQLTEKSSCHDKGLG